MNGVEEQNSDTGDNGRPGGQWKGTLQTRDFSGSPGVKLVLIGVLIVALLIPAMMVWALVEERADRAESVAASIARGWGGPQVINGPYLVVPYTISKRSGQNMKVVTRHAVISPESLTSNGDIDVEERRKSIYKAQLYQANLELVGWFSPKEIERIRERGGKPLPGRAFLAIGVLDMTGFRSHVSAEINRGKAQMFLPGLNGLKRSAEGREPAASGIHLPFDDAAANGLLDFKIMLALNGSSNLSIVPAGQTSAIAIRSGWPHPGFAGQFLPEKREISENGFSAQWTIPALSRGIEAVRFSKSLPPESSAVTVDFVEPLKFYQITARTLKYSIGFFALVFLAVFVLELNGKRSMHWIQYMLVGLAMIIFYILLLAIAEQTGFAIAYLVSSGATTLLIAWYVGDSLGHGRGSRIMGALLTALFLLMYLIMSEEDYALLAGAITAFLAIAATMFATRKVNWSSATSDMPAAG